MIKYPSPFHIILSIFLKFKGVDENVNGCLYFPEEADGLTFSQKFYRLGPRKERKEDMVAKLTKEMKTIFEKELAVIATASKDGIPNVGPKGSMYVFDDETLAYAEGTGEKTLRNLQENPKVAVMVVDREKAEGYQVKETAELLSNEDFFEQVAKRQEQRKRPRSQKVVKIRIEEIYSIKPGMTARKIV
jgi:predicted pyridoxine 5'-phosphate oxidase superfamily flavin-nucleotide-binding protein